MQQLVLYTLCALTLLCARLSAGEGRGQADDCTSGFTSVDRIDAVLGNYGTVFRSSESSVQAIVPDTTFTCNGSILSWTFGARWEGNTPALTELQIWRSSGDGSYDKVGSTTIITEENTTGLYQYPLSSPLPFQAGDILGYYQPAPSTSQLGLRYEEVTTNSYEVFSLPTPASQFNIATVTDTFENRYQAMVGVETDPPGCGCGFMSVERMRILLGLDTVGNVANRPQRQQITPDIKFTCDGMITKWIVGAGWDGRDFLYPELQVWRNIGNDVYHKINGTFITTPTEIPNRIYEYDDFSPIPFQAGDILGVFLPRDRDARLRLLSETTNNPTNYYLITANSDSESSFDTIDIQSTQSLISRAYHPLVSVEIVRSSSTSSAAPLPTSETATVSKSGSQSNAVPTSPAPPSGGGDSSSSQSSSVAAGIGGGIAAAAVLLVVVLVVAVVVVLVLRQRRSKSAVELNGRGNVGSLDNPVYSEEVAGGGQVPMNVLHYHQTGPQEDLYEAPHPEEEAVYEAPLDTEEAVYDAPLDDATYDEVPPDAMYQQSSRESAATEPDGPGIYRKFDNPIYDDAAPDNELYADVDTEYK